MIDFAIYAAYVLIAICAITAIVFGVMHLLRDPKQALWSVVGVVVVAVVFGIGYALSSSDFTFPGMEEKFSISPSGVQMVGAGIITFYLLAGITIVAGVVTEVMNVFK
ncbi:MAG: hypothetical protein EA412_09110 [Chitinophagaceae bacterium]|jgi:hypothetical protein|nr:MAG: hypothetical protein EA412_09110 [Chitinophagaceae bacterium]